MTKGTSLLTEIQHYLRLSLTICELKKSSYQKQIVQSELYFMKQSFMALLLLHNN